jgi:hypothetical protein
MAYAERWAAVIGGPAYAIDDQTAIQVTDDGVEVISEGHCGCPATLRHGFSAGEWGNPLWLPLPTNTVQSNCTARPALS